LKSKRQIIILLLSVVLALIFLVGGCSNPAASSGTATNQGSTDVSKSAVTADKTYRALNPVGELPPVQLITMPPRIDKLEGKRIAFIQSEADPVVMPALWEKIKKAYPTVDWVATWSSVTSPIKLTDEELKGVQAAIIGVAW
jgi:hypothetical protein